MYLLVDKVYFIVISNDYYIGNVILKYYMFL